MSQRLSKPQSDMLLVLSERGAKGDRTPFHGGRNAGRVASSWYRTVESLARRGLVVVAREGDAWRAWLPEYAPKNVKRLFHNCGGKEDV